MDRARERGSEDDQRRAHHGEQRRELAAGPVEDQPAARGGDAETARAREERPEEPARALGREVEREPETEEAVRRADDAEVGGAGGEHLGLGAEEAEPRAREKRGREPDRRAGSRRHQGTGAL